MQTQTNASATYLAIVATLEANNPSENRKDTANASLAVELAAYVDETYIAPADGLRHLARILEQAANAMLGAVR